MAPPLPSSDADLVRLANGGRDDAFAALYERYFPRIYDFLARLLGDRQEAADVAQDTFIRALEQLGDLREPERFKSWLFTIAHRGGLNKIRGRRMVAVGAMNDDTDRLARVVDEDRFRDPVEAASAAEAADFVWEAARGLDERTYVVLDLHVRHGLESAEIADVLGVSRGNAYTMVSRMKRSVADSIGTYLLARKGTASCGELAAIVSSSTLPPMTPTLRKSVERHARTCATCQATRDELLAPLVVYGSLVLIPPPDGARAAIWAAVLATGGAAAAGQSPRGGGAAAVGAGAGAGAVGASAAGSAATAASGSGSSASAASGGGGLVATIAGWGAPRLAAAAILALLVAVTGVWGISALTGGDDAPVEVLSGGLTADDPSGSGTGGDGDAAGGTSSTTTVPDTTSATTTTTVPATTTTTPPPTTTTLPATTTTTTTTIASGGGGGGTVTTTTVPPGNPPVAIGDAVELTEDGVVSIAVLANDSDPDGSLAGATIAIVGAPSHGTAATSGDTVDYTPFPDYAGADSLIYEVCDATAACATAAVTIEVVAVNDAPFAVGPEAITIGEDQSVAFDPLADATDPDGDTVTLARFDAVTAAGGTVRLGSLIYVPPRDYSGMDSFTYTITDGIEELTLTVEITIEPRNDAPDLTVTVLDPVPEGSIGAAVAVVDVFDVDSDAVEVVLTGAAAPDLAFDAETGTIVTTAAFDHERAPRHTIFVRATDSEGASTVRPLTFEVANVNEAPSLGDSALAGSIDGATGDLLGTVQASDPDGDDLTFSLVESPPGVIQIDKATGEIRLTGNVPSEPQDIEIVVRVADPGGLTDERAYTLSFVDVTAPSGQITISPDPVYESLGDGFCPLGEAKADAVAEVSDTHGVAAVSLSWLTGDPKDPQERVAQLTELKGGVWQVTLEFDADTVVEGDKREVVLTFEVTDFSGNVASAQLIITVFDCPGEAAT